MAVEPSGRLELTWTNKHLRLLADEDGGYQWVPPADYRVAEVRLLHDVEEVGETHAEHSRAKDNLLIQGDALHALTSLCELPEFACEYVGKVKLAYLDPPFNTQQDLRALRRRTRALGLADDDARPAVPDPQAALTGRIGLGALRRLGAGVLEGDDGRGVRAGQLHLCDHLGEAVLAIERCRHLVVA